GENVSDSWSDPCGGQNCCCDTAWARIDNELPELRCLHPGARRGVQIVAAKTLIREKEKQLVLPDRSAQAPAKLPEIGVYSRRHLALCAVKPVEGIPIGILVFEEPATVKLIGAAFGDDLDLSAGSAAVFSGIGTRKNGDLLDRFLVRSDDRGATKPKTVNAHTVDGEIV